MLLVITLENTLSEASSADDRLDVGPPESWIQEPLSEDTVRVCPHLSARAVLQSNKSKHQASDLS